MNKINKTKYVWLVNQTQPCADYYERTIAVFDNQQDAVNLARQLNQEYGRNCKFDSDWDYVDYDCDYDLIHCYETECIKINPELKDFFL